jgi:hypothetical protein
MQLSKIERPGRHHDFAIEKVPLFQKNDLEFEISETAIGISIIVSV